jgi:uncharacterized OB-fold protein
VTDIELPEPLTEVITPVRLEYRYTPGESPSQFLRHIPEGKLLGRRCPECGKVYAPPRGACSMCGALFGEEVELADTGTVTTFCVVNINFANRAVDLPYVCAEILFDGSDTTAQLLLQGIDPEQVRMGMRVRTVWKPTEERTPSMASISHVEPVDEPDAPFDAYAEFV